MNKMQELARFLLGKSGSVDFVMPAPSLVRSDSRELRKRILELTQKEARELGLSRSTVHYLKKQVGDSRPFRIYKPVLRKLQKINNRPVI